MPELEMDLDDSLMRFKPTDPQFLEKIIKEIPLFGEFIHEQAKKPAARFKIAAWIACMYDPNSPLRREVKDLYKRKIYAGNIVGLKPEGHSGKYQKWLEDMFVGKDAMINKLVVKYIASFSSPEYMQLIGHATMVERALEKIISGEADNNVSKMLDTSTEKVKELTNFIYGSGERDEIAEARRALYKQISYDLSEMRPEQVARAIAEGIGLPSEWSPYGDYVPDEMRFVGDDPNIARDDEESLP